MVPGRVMNVSGLEVRIGVAAVTGVHRGFVFSSEGLLAGLITADAEPLADEVSVRALAPEPLRHALAAVTHRLGVPLSTAYPGAVIRDYTDAQVALLRQVLGETNRVYSAPPSAWQALAEDKKVRFISDGNLRAHLRTGMDLAEAVDVLHRMVFFPLGTVFYVPDQRTHEVAGHIAARRLRMTGPSSCSPRCVRGVRMWSPSWWRNWCSPARRWPTTSSRSWFGPAPTR